MSEPKSDKSCDLCHAAPASVHFTEIVNNQVKELHACPRCAEEKGLQGVGAEVKFSIADPLVSMFAEISTAEGKAAGIECPGCGMVYSNFRDTGRLGCPACYETFLAQLRPLLRRIHGTTTHVGKAPVGDGDAAERRREVQRLQEQLEHAVHREEFERAAELRDRIRKLHVPAAGGADGEKEPAS
jgi:protein arginine kinase activator